METENAIQTLERLASVVVKTAKPFVVRLNFFTVLFYDFIRFSFISTNLFQLYHARLVFMEDVLVALASAIMVGLVPYVMVFLSLFDIKLTSF